MSRETPPDEAPRALAVEVGEVTGWADDMRDPVACGAHRSCTCEEALAIHWASKDEEAEAVHWLAEADRDAATDCEEFSDVDDDEDSACHFDLAALLCSTWLDETDADP